MLGLKFGKEALEFNPVNMQKKFGIPDAMNCSALCRYQFRQLHSVQVEQLARDDIDQYDPWSTYYPSRVSVFLIS